MLEIDNQRLYNENDQLKRMNCQNYNHEENVLREKNVQFEKLINSLQLSNVIMKDFMHFFSIWKLYFIATTFM